jgi:hypothetical protein
MAFHRPGSYAALFGIDTDNQWKIGGWSTGAVSYCILHEGNSFALISGYHLQAGSRNIYSAGFFQASMVTGGATANQGVVNGAISLAATQTYQCNAGSTITAITMVAGQVGRILVSSAGAINITAAGVHWSVGSPAWGLAFTVVNIFTHDGNTFWCTTTPFNS